MKIYKTLGSKQTLLDKGQASLMAVFFFIGAIYENLFFLLFAPTIVFAVTFIIKEKYFSGKPEWGIYVLRMLKGSRIYYSRQIKDEKHI
ncbi:MAG TPA: hypothetical protein PLD55_08325 [bacterium]|jgi:hypothetical protein|nr:hypothetical protein [bacterium]HNZ53731.1 hypothetical protein [bacterium]HOB71823.1 hypothetical protein [bacterium]HQM84668.1 hypothetical protein [bacterium]